MYWGVTLVDIGLVEDRMDLRSHPWAITPPRTLLRRPKTVTVLPSLCQYDFVQ